MNLSDTFNRATTEATETTEKGQALAKNGFRQLSSKVSGVLDRVDGLGIDTFLRYAGLTRRSSSLFASAGAFGVGVAVGAGLGVLFAPSSGVNTRRRISQFMSKQFTQVGKTYEGTAETVQATTDDMKSRVDEALRADSNETPAPNKNGTRAHRLG